MHRQIKKTNKVTKANELIQSTHKLSLQEHRIISTLISMIEPSDEHFQIYKFSVRDFQEMIGVKGNMHTYIKKIVTGLQEKVVEIPTSNSTLVVNWLASAEYFDSAGYIELEISNKLKPYLLGLKERFTSYHLQYILKLNSFYSMRLYELLKQYQFIKYNQRVIELDVLRNWLGFIEDDNEKYKQFGHFNSKVLKVAEAEINGKTDVSFSYKAIKKGRKVIAIEFIISNKNSNDALEKSQIRLGDGGQAEFELLPNENFREPLLSLGVSKNQIDKILNTHSAEQIQRNINFVMEKRDEGVITGNVGGYAYKAITEDWGNSQQSDKPGMSKPVSKPVIKPIRTEMIPDWFDMSEDEKEKEKKRILESGTIEEKRQLYLEEFISVENLEDWILRAHSMNMRIAPDEQRAKQKTIDEQLMEHIKPRIELNIELINVEDFVNPVVKDLYQMALDSILEPIKT